jgi:hypothetical protein
MSSSPLGGLWEWATRTSPRRPCGGRVKMRPTRRHSRARAGSPPATFRPDMVSNVEQPGRLPLPHASVSGSESASESKTKRSMRFELELALDPDPDPDWAAPMGRRGVMGMEGFCRRGDRSLSLTNASIRSRLQRSKAPRNTKRIRRKATKPPRGRERRIPILPSSTRNNFLRRDAEPVEGGKPVITAFLRETRRLGVKRTSPSSRREQRRAPRTRSRTSQPCPQAVAPGPRQRMRLVKRSSLGSG